MVSKLYWIKTRKVVDLAGDWNQEWGLDDGLNPVPSDNNRATLKQFASRVHGSFFFNGREYMFRGRLESGTYLNGEWFDRETGPTYSGTFQLRISAYAKDMSGKWIGFSDRDPKIIKSGPWVWKLIRKT